MVSRIYKTNLNTAYKYNCEQCIDPPCSVKCSGQGGGFVSCSPKYIIKKNLLMVSLIELMVFPALSMMSLSLCWPVGPVPPVGGRLVVAAALVIDVVMFPNVHTFDL